MRSNSSPFRAGCLLSAVILASAPVFGRNGQFAMVGAIYSPSDKIDLDIGLRKGLNRAETDTAFLLGATFRW